MTPAMWVAWFVVVLFIARTERRLDRLERAARMRGQIR